MISVRNIKVPIDHTNIDVEARILKKLKISKEELINYEIKKKSIDSRDKNNIFYVYNVDVKVKNQAKCLKIKDVGEAKVYKYKVPFIKDYTDKRPVIIGCGPAGLLAGIVLAQSGLKPLIIEQGKNVDARMEDINKFWESGELLDSSNVQFGAGGAGTFSDGKLTTGVNNPRKYKLMEELILAGAPENIKYLSKPHLGTDLLVDIVRNMCKKIQNLGGEILFESKFVGFEQENNKLKSITINSNQVNKKIECDYLILAIGHSARDTFYTLFDKGIDMKPKTFAMGVRVEHKQVDVNSCQYGTFATKLDAASYKFNVKLDNGRTLHTFCMCPGGVVVGAASGSGQVVTNGMSYYKRDLVNSNSALLVNINPEDYNYLEHPLNGIKFQESLEKKAYELGGSNYYAPAQKVGDFLEDKLSSSFDKVKPSYMPGVKSVRLSELFPEFMNETIKEGIINLRDRIDFFKDDEAVITAVESRSSSPVTIVRDQEFMSNVRGIIPCGEGAGYAGGIVSAAIDGIKCAEKVVESITSKY